MCQYRRGPINLLDGLACESLCLGVSEGSRVGFELDDVWVRQELPVGATEDTPSMGCDVDVGDLLSGLSSARCEGVEACFDGVGLGG